MPNQDPSNQNNQANSPDPGVSFTTQTDLPPMPADFQNVQKDSGSASPPTPNINNIISSPKKKFGTGKIIATILGILVLVGGLGAGTYLIGQKQLFQQKAAGTSNTGKTTNNTNSVGKSTPTPTGNSSNTTGKSTPTPTGNSSNTTGKSSTTSNACVTNSSPCETDNECCSNICYNGYCGNCVTNSSPCETDNECCSNICYNGYCGNGSPTSSSSVGSVVNNISEDGTSLQAAPYCAAVTTYSSDWTLISSSERSSLTAGTNIYFCVSGYTPSGSFDSARFTINGVLQADTTTQRSGSTDFCQAYTIPSETTTISVSAQVHHSILGWF